MTTSRRTSRGPAVEKQWSRQQAGDCFDLYSVEWQSVRNGQVANVCTIAPPVLRGWQVSIGGDGLLNITLNTCENS
jgi:hypothetical protein